MMSTIEIAVTSAVLCAGIGLTLVPRDSARASLAYALCVTLPFVGPLLALIATRTQSTGQVVSDLEADAYQVRERYDTREGVVAHATQPPLLDRLLSDRADHRLSAHVAIASRGDAECIGLLRWVIKHGDSDAVLDAALSLEELELRWQQELREARESYAEAEEHGRTEAKHALALGTAAHHGVETSLADVATVPALFREARRAYAHAALLAPEQRADIGVRRIELALAAGHPQEAASVLEELAGEGVSSAELRALRYQVRFNARHAVRNDRFEVAHAEHKLQIARAS